VDDEEAANSPSQQSFGVQYGGGDIKYTDVNGDGVITTADRVPIGYPTSPEIIYGFGISFGHYGFDFSVFFQGLARESFWIDATNANNASTNKYGTAPFTNNGQLLKAYADSHWSENDRNIYALWPRYSAYRNFNNTQTSTWWMRDGSFIRLKQLELGYTLPKTYSKKVGVDNLRVYTSLDDWFLFTKYPGFDPEVASTGSYNGAGMDKGSFPNAKRLIFGINVSF
jgi:hypothetical protein